MPAPATRNAILMDGVFTLDPGGRLHSPAGDVGEALAPLVGTHVRVIAHHVVPNPPDPTRWGGGCCAWKPDPCPAGHHLRPTWLYYVGSSGVLVAKDEDWCVEDDWGDAHPLHLRTNLPGHAARLLVVSELSATNLDGVPSVVSDMRKRVEALGGVLDALRKG